MFLYIRLLKYSFLERRLAISPLWKVAPVKSSIAKVALNYSNALRHQNRVHLLIYMLTSLRLPPSSASSSLSP